MTIELVGFGSHASISGEGRNVAIDTGSGIYVYDRELADLIPVSIFDGEGDSYPKISADGNFVAFISEADNLVVGDTNEAADVFIHNRQTGETERISVASDGTESNSVNFYGLNLSASGELAMGDNGRFVAFSSLSDNLVENDTNGDPDIFVRDRQTGETTRVSVASDGTEAESPTGYHTFYGSHDPAMSGDGRYVAFSSHADNLVAGDTNQVADIFVRDRLTGETTRVSVASDGTEAKGSEAEDIVWYVPEGGSSEPAIGGGGRYVAFTAAAETDNLVPGDTNEASDVFVRDRLTGETTRVSVSSDGIEGNDDSRSPSISADGRYVAFLSRADNLVPGDTDGGEDVFVRDRETGITRKILSGASEAAIAADGLHIVATTDSGIFVADWQADGNISPISDLQNPLTFSGESDPILEGCNPTDSIAIF